jgi:hypothetical protein
MPWLETSPMEQRERFIRDHRLDLYAMAELCARYGLRDLTPITADRPERRDPTFLRLTALAG